MAVWLNNMLLCWCTALRHLGAIRLHHSYILKLIQRGIILYLFYHRVEVCSSTGIAGLELQAKSVLNLSKDFLALTFQPEYL